MKSQTVETERRRFPSFDCPDPECHAKNIAFAANAESKNSSELVPIESLEEIGAAELIIRCPKCRKQFALIRHRSIPVSLPEFASVSALRQPN